jgi:hypothetical protein
MCEDGQREPGGGGTADRGRPGAERARRDAGGESPPGDGQDHAGTPRPDALIPALDQGQLAALREVGREWDRVSADPQVWRQALPVDPSPGGYPRPVRSARPCSPGSRPSRERRAAAADPGHERFRDAAHAAGPGRPGTEAAGRRPAAGRQRDRVGADAQARSATRTVGCRQSHPHRATRRYSLIVPPARICLRTRYCPRTGGCGGGAVRAVRPVLIVVGLVLVQDLP